MPERPLVLFAAPTVADKERRYGGAPKYYFPSHSRQVSRLTPQFNVLQNTMNSGSIYFTNYATGVDPEYTLVFETVGDPHDFYKAVDKLKETYPTVEWLMELSDSNLDNSDDFYVMNSQSVRDDSKKLTTKLFCIMTNQVALSEIISLWKHYQTDENFKIPRGMTGFKQLFRTLYDVHKWGIQERLEDTGLTEIWKEELQDASLEKVKVQIELFFRSSISKRQEVEDNIKNIVIQVGGEIFSCSVIPEIEYHAILAAVPREYAQKIIDREEVALVIAEPIMFLKPCVQAIFSSDNNNFSDSNSFSVPTNVIEDPIIAMFDGAPQANHPLLKGMLTVDDPDGFESFYEVRERVHGTSMASLILRGQDMSIIEEKIRKVYVRPIMKPETWNNKVMEYIPDDFLLVDKIHEAVRRLFEPEAGQVASNVRIINLSIGIRYREFYNIISPLARLLDWLSYKYRVLFIVSAGNHPDEIETGIDFNNFKNLSDEEKDSIIIKFIDQDIRNKRLLSPAESMNALTVGAIFADNNDENPIGSLAKLCSDNIPAVYSSFGSGINNAIKPDIFFPGGRNFVHEDYMHRGMVKWRESSTRAPGISSAAPGLTMGAIVNKAFSFGTSDATALVTNKAQECYAVLDEIFMKETGMGVPNEYVAVLIKAMLAHGASWNGWDKMFQGVLNISGTNAKNALHRYLGYGEPDVDKVKECTKEQVTLIGFGDIAQDKAFIYSIPIPIEFHEKRLKRKLTVTLAYLSPIHPSSIKYREKQVWMTINNGNSLIGSRVEYDYHAVQRGTLQHEIFENNSIEVWDIDESIELKINCRGCASENNPEMLIPYALFATFEMAPDCGVEVYQKVVTKVQTKNAIKTM